MVIDELLVVLGLDSSKFNQGQREALDAFRKTKQGADEFAKDVERQSMKMADVFGIVRRGALGIVGALAGGEAASFINHIAGMDAATGRFAKTVNTNVENLSTWQGMIRMIGGEGAAATSVMVSLQRQIETVRQGGGMFEGKFAALMGRAGATLSDDSDASLRKIRSYISGEMAAGRMTGAAAGNWLSSIPGMNQDMINLLTMTTNEFNALAAAAKKAGVATNESAEAGALLTKAFTTLILRIEDVTRMLSPLFDILTKPFNQIGKGDAPGLEKMMQGLTGGISFEPGSAMDRLDKALWGDSKGAAGGRASGADRETWIRAFAQSLGIDPQVAVKVAKSEGFGTYVGDKGTSFGDFQLHVTPGGRGKAVGDAFRAETGLDPSDPANEKAMDRFALQWAAKHGWGDFHGAARVGLGQWSGISSGAKAAAAGRNISNSSSSSSSSSEVNIGTVHVNAPNATDADGIAKEIGPAMKRSSIAAPANYGLT